MKTNCPDWLRWLVLFILMGGTDANTLRAVEIRVPLMTRAPVIDGAIGEDEWAEAFRGIGVGDASGLLAPRQGIWWIGTDGKQLFLASRTETPPQGSLLARIAPEQRDAEEIGVDDALEVWVAPAGPGPVAPPYFQFMGNPCGTIYDVMFDPSQSTPSQPWDGPWQFRNSVKEGWWESEVAIPLEKLVKPGATFPNSFGFRITRNWKQPFEYTSTEGWGGGGFANTATMSRFELDPDAPRIQMLSLGDWLDANLDLRLSLANPTSKRQELRVKFEVASTSSMPPSVNEETIALEPGQKREYRVQRELFKDVECAANLAVASAVDGKTWLARQWKFRTKKPETIWTTVVREKKAVDLLFAYSPSRNKVRAKVDFSGMRDAREVRKVLLTVRAKDGKETLAETSVDQFTDQVAETLFDVPDFKDGTYELRGSLEGKTTLKDAVVKSFERKHFAWEANTIGISDQVVEPFQALAVKDRTVKAIFREYQLDNGGLCKQIKSEDRPLLAAPMELQVVANGQPLALKKTKVRFLEKKPSQVVAEAGWEAAGIRGRTRSRFEYDGLMNVELELSGNPQTEVQRMDLTVSLVNAEVALIYAIGGGIRGNYAGKMPEGEGEIWNNTKATTYGVPNKFLPYLWLGGVRRGLAWYADSDQGWAVNKDEPELALIRQGTTCKLVLHLIAKPTVLAAPRRLKFAFLPTPVKPRPTDWRNWTFNGGYSDSHYVRIWGSCLYWGGMGGYGDVYPRDHDYSLLERFVAVEKQGQVTDADNVFLAKWNEGYRKNRETKNFVASTACALRGSVLKGATVPYTSSRDVRQTLPEFQVFQDDWVTDPYTSRGWTDDDMIEAKIEPVRTYQDYALWHYQKLMNIGFASGIYWDNTYPFANFNPFAAPAPGNFDEVRNHPGLGITSLRNLVRRTAVMYRLAGRVPHTIAHMTNGTVIPMLAFSTIALDWEMKYGADDFQDRFKEDFIFASTLGEQAGTVPLVLSGIIPTKEKPVTWLTRTLLGTTLIYEIKVWYNTPADNDLVKKVGDILYGFGYGQPDCKVYRYWEDPLFKSDRKDVRSILLARNGKLLLVNTDFGGGGPCRLELDRKALDLPAALKAIDAETREPVECQDGRLQFNLKRHDFNMILVEPSS